MNETDKDIMTLIEFAKYIQVHTNTVRKMIKSGQLAAFKVGSGKNSSYRIAKAETLRLPLMNFNLHKTIDKDIK